MRHIFCLLPILSLIAMVGCSSNMDATEKAVYGDKPMSESTGAVTQDLNQRQTNDVDGMEQGGLMNKYEEEQMDGAIGTTPTE